MKIPSPGELGFPEKYDAWRPNQLAAIEMLQRPSCRGDVLSMPTGGGKTGVVVCDALLSRKPTAFVTESLALMDQYMEDYASVGMVKLMGKRNYPCKLRPDDPDYSCEQGQSSRCLYSGTVACPLSQAEMRAATSLLVVTNYMKWIKGSRLTPGLGHIQRIVFDEGDRAPDVLAQAMRVTLTSREIEDVMALDWPVNRSEMVDWKEWAVNARAEAHETYLAMQKQVATDPKPSWVKVMLHMRSIVQKLSTLATARPEHWVCDETDKGYLFDPIRVGRYAESKLLMRVPRIIVVSATVRPKTLYLMGMPKQAFRFTEYDSEFDPKRCPIYYIPTLRVDRRARDLSMLWIRLDQIAARRTDRKGLIQTVSYAGRDEILSRSRFAYAMLVNERGEPSTDTLRLFRASDPGTILASPSFGRGYDFPGRDAEWQFVCKIPFPDSRSKIVKARQEDDPEYAPYCAINTLVQYFGRIVRSKTDQGENFIGDSHLDWFLPRWGYLAPRSFHGFFRRVEIVPPPPPPL